MNDTLQAENREYVKKITELENQIEELESDNGKLERCSTYIKGMLKNFVEADKLYKKLIKVQTAHTSGIKNNLKDYKKRLFIDFTKISLFSTLFSIFFFVLQLKVAIPTFLFYMVDKLVVYGFVVYYMYRVISTGIDTDIVEINELKKRIKEINKAQDYIHDLIDTN
jgi:prefoldin subunit 5